MGEKLAQPDKSKLHTKLLWSLIAAVAAADALCLFLGTVSLAPLALLGNVVVIGVLLGVSYIYTHVRHDARIAALTHMAAAALAFTAAIAIFSYASAAWNRPLIDASLAGADKALGLDWLGAYNWVAEHRRTNGFLMLAYWALAGQMVLLFAVMNFKGRIARGWETLWLFMLAALVAALCAALWPAAGAFHFYQVNENEPYLRALLGLRDGTLTTISRESMQGIIQFPSLHIAWAIVYVYAARGMKILFPLLLANNLILCLATPAVGGHHFVDLLAGLVLALGVIYVVRKIAAAGLLPADAPAV